MTVIFISFNKLVSVHVSKNFINNSCLNGFCNFLPYFECSSLYKKCNIYFFSTNSSSFSPEEEKCLEKSIREKMPYVVVYSDFTEKERLFLTSEKGLEINFDLEKPDYVSVYLNKYKLLTFNSYKERYFDYFQNILYSYHYSVFDDFYKQIDIISQNKANHKKHPFFYYETSFFGNKYLKREVLPVDFGLNIYRYCNQIKSIDFFLFSIHKYFNFLWLIDSILLLRGKARKEYAYHDLSLFILYKEQALVYADFILNEILGEEGLSIIWLRILANNLIKYSFTLPNDPDPNSIFLTNSLFDELK